MTSADPLNNVGLFFNRMYNWPMLPGSIDTDQLGGYVMLEQIAVGGMAEIYLAKTQGVAGFEKFLCLKVIHPNFADDEQFIEMLIDEAKIAVGLNHVNIAQIFDLGHDGKQYFIAMEYIDGADLFKIMRSLSERDVDVPVDTAVYIAQEICTGLDYAHRKRAEDGSPLGIIHRDISPQNILVSNAGEVKIIDFGIAKAASRSRKTQAGVIKGKYYYMSPEQAWGDTLDSRSDIFSAGIILYEVLTGQMLYLEEDMSKLLDIVRKADIPRPSTRRAGIPPELENTVMKALAKRPADRWQTAHEFQVALTSFLYGYSPDFTPERLADLLHTAISEEETAKARPDEGQFGGEKETEEEDDELIMSRLDFRPEAGHSVIFNVDDYLPPRSTDETGDLDDMQGLDDDDDERTMVSPPPEEIMERLGIGRRASGELSLELDSGEMDLGEYEENAPTMVSTNPSLRPQDMDLSADDSPFSPPAHKKPVPAPAQEVVVPPSLKPPPRAERDLNLTPTIERQPSGEHPDMTGPLPQVGTDGAVAPPEAPGAKATQSAVWSSAPGVVQTGTAPTPSKPGNDWSWPPDPGAPPKAQATPPGTAAPATQQPSPTWPPQGPQTTDEWASSSNLQGLQAAWQGGKLDSPFASTLSPDLDLTEEKYYSSTPKRRLRVILAVAITMLALSALAAGVFYLVTYSGVKTGAAKIVSDPAGAEISLDGKKTGQKTPATLAISDLKSKHVVELQLSKYKGWRQEFEFSGSNTQIEVLANLQPIKGKLTVRSDPSKAEVYVNGLRKGTTPLTVGNLDTSEDVKVEVRKQGHATITRTVQWEDRNEIDVTLSLEKQR